MDRVLQALEDIPPRTPEQAAKTAVRHNRKVAKRYPLFAATGVLPQAWQWDAEYVMQRFDVCHREFVRKTVAEFQARAVALRADVAALVTPDELAELDRKITIVPNDAVYHADYWHQHLRRLGVADWWERHNPLVNMR